MGGGSLVHARLPSCSLAGGAGLAQTRRGSGPGVFGDFLGATCLTYCPPLYGTTLPDLVPGHHSRVADPLLLLETTDTTPKPCTCPPVGGASTEQPHTQSTTCPPAQQSHTLAFVAPLPCCPGAFTIQQKRLDQDKPGQRCILLRLQQKKKKPRKRRTARKKKRKIDFSDRRNPPKTFTPLFGEVAKVRTLTEREE